MVIQAGFVIYTIMVVGFGTNVYAAHLIGMRIQSLSFLPGMGFATAATTLVGQSLGAKRPLDAEKFGWACAKLSFATMGSLTALLFVFAAPMARAFPPEAGVAALAKDWIRIMALGIPPIALYFTIAGSLRGAGDTRWPLYASLVGLYVVRLPVSYLLAFRTPLGIYGLWAAMVLEYYARSLVISLRFRKGRWKELRV